MNLQDKEDYLQHYGVLGMKWGKRKDRSSGSSRKSAKAEKTKSKLISKQKKVVESAKARANQEEKIYKSEKSLGVQGFSDKYGRPGASTLPNYKERMAQSYKESLNYLYQDVKASKANLQRAEKILKSYSNMKVNDLSKRQVKKKAKKIANKYSHY